MKKINQLFVFGLTVSTLLFTACSSDDDNYTFEPDADYIEGVVVLNEGNFGAGNASVSFIGDNGSLINSIFQAANGGQNLGDVAQSMYMDDDKAYIVLNGSGTVEVVNRYTFEHVGTISSGLSNPRYILIENGKGYVSNWGDPSDTTDDFIAVVNLNSYTVEASIPVVEGPEKMTKANGKIYVAHMGGWGYGNSVSVINTANNSISGSIEVGDVPHGMVEDNGILYVLCSGKAAWTGEETDGGLFAYHIASNAMLSVSTISNQHPTHLVKDDGKLYYTMDGNVYSTSLTNPVHSTTPLFSMADQSVFGAYGFAVNNGKIYVADAGDYISNGTVYVYSTSGNLLNDYSVGFLPNDFGFND